MSWEGNEGGTCTQFSPLIYSYTISFIWPTLQRAASWIVCHFKYLVFTQYHKQLHRCGGQGTWSGGFFHQHKLNTARWSVSVLDITILTNSEADWLAKLSNQSCSKFESGGNFSSQTHNCHLKTTRQALGHIR